MLEFLESLQNCNSIKKKLRHRYFKVKFAKFLRALIQGQIQDEAKEAIASFKKWNIALKKYRSYTIIIQQILHFVKFNFWL